jgi:hypothetical protein
VRAFEIDEAVPAAVTKHEDARLKPSRDGVVRLMAVLARRLSWRDRRMTPEWG